MKPKATKVFRGCLSVVGVFCFCLKLRHMVARKLNLHTKTLVPVPLPLFMKATTCSIMSCNVIEQQYLTQHITIEETDSQPGRQIASHLCEQSLSLESSLKILKQNKTMLLKAISIPKISFSILRLSSRTLNA